MADEEAGSAPPPPHLVRLNPEQHRAVTTTQGPLLVLAGAGSGKTRVLTRRIAHLLYEGVEPKNILAVTFTNKAAAEMRERVEELVGDAAERLWVSTFHSSCARILRTDIEALGWTRRFAIYDDDDQQRMIKGILAERGQADGPTASEVRSRIDHFKNQMMSPDQVLRERRTHINDSLLLTWHAYEEALKAADALDFNDLVGKTVELLAEHEEILEKWRERFQFVLVDEYQDTNRAQYRLLRLLADGHHNLAVVGDDDQSIYGFRGADVSNILNFQSDYPEAVVVRLEQNYRSTKRILTLANAVVEQNPDRLDKKLWTDSNDGTKVQIIVQPSVQDEAARVAGAVQKLRRRFDFAWGDIAVIYRTKSVARHFEAALRQLSVPYRLVGGRKFYERREVRDLLAYLRILANPADDAAVLRVVNVPTRGVGAKTQAKLREEAAKRGLPLLATARQLSGGQSVGEKGLASFADLMDELQSLARDADLPMLVAEAVERSGYRAMLEGEVDSEGETTREAAGRLENLDLLVQDAATFKPPQGVIGGMEQLTAWLDRIALTADADDVPEGGEVTLMTVHASKGLEFPVVFVVQMNEGVFPHERSMDRGLEEERRLAYVAFTRAMKRLIVTRSLRHPVQGGRSGKAAQPSRFLFGIPLEVVDGDVPDGEPASGSAGDRRSEARKATQKLGVFLQHRAKRPVLPPEMEGDYTLLDIESVEQLQVGVRVHHPRFGVGRSARWRRRPSLCPLGAASSGSPLRLRIFALSRTDSMGSAGPGVLKGPQCLSVRASFLPAESDR